MFKKLNSKKRERERVRRYMIGPNTENQEEEMGLNGIYS